MERTLLNAKEREVLGKKVKKLRMMGLIPAHVFGKNEETEHVSVFLKDFLPVLHQAGETGLIDLKIGAKKIRPVLIRDVQVHPLTGNLLHIDFYQVNLSEKVKVPVPIIITGEEIEAVKMGEAVILQTLSEVEVEALPTDLVENIEVDITPLKNIDDAITVGELNYDKSKLTIHLEPEEVVVKLAPAITEEMKKLLEEQAAEAAAVAAEQAAEEGAEAPVEGEEVAEGEKAAGEEAVEEDGEAKEETPAESADEEKK
ncbi:50S ribosomal protein L25 [Candidatus Daviesbacteria bacterium]|nr:50S ribosomal protein L25 [Candidatus Daviesbacteria bacterium]